MLFGACATDECSGSVLSCPWADLNERQEKEACDLITASIDAPAGTKYECTSGENAGLYLTVESSSTCVSHSYAEACPVTVQQTLDCFKAARTNACAAFEDSGSCGRLLVAAQQCQ
jgi:hypothetical protein